MVLFAHYLLDVDAAYLMLDRLSIPHACALVKFGQKMFGQREQRGDDPFTFEIPEPVHEGDEGLLVLLDQKQEDDLYIFPLS